jgi:ATP-dependent protease ClpP protease subunit
VDNKPFRTTRPIASLRAGRADWFRIQAKAEGPAQLHIYDEIGYFGVTAADMLAELSNVKGDLEVHLNTPGGEVFDGIAIFNALKQREGIVRIVIDSLAASIGSVIAMAADPGNLIISKNASMMIHDGFGMGIGNAKDLRELADLLDKTSDNIASIYADRTGQPVSQWREAMLAETWYVGREAVDAGLADFVQGAEPADGPDPGLKIAATWDLSVFAKRPHQPPAEPTKPADPPPADPDLGWIDQLDLEAFKEAMK